MQYASKHLVIICSLVLLLLPFFSVLQPTPALAQSFNQEINYQGKLADNLGATVSDGTYSMVFRLYTVATAGTHVWTETQDVTVTNGLFSVMLGTSTSLSGIDFNRTLYLGVDIEADGEMTPRKILGAVPAAFEANNSQTLGGVASTSFLRGDIPNAASALLSFTGGFVSSASSTISELTTGTTTATTLMIDGEAYTSIDVTGLQNQSGALGVDTAYLNTLYASTSAFDTSSKLAAILTDETGTGAAVFANSPTLTGTIDAVAADFSSTLTLSGTGANLALGSNYISEGGTDQGIMFDGTGSMGLIGQSATDVLNDYSVGGATIFQINAKNNDSAGFNLNAAGASTANRGTISFMNNGTRTAFIETEKSGSGVLDADLVFATKATSTAIAEAMRITRTGNVGIGDASPDAHLEISANNGSGGAVFFASSNDSNDGDLFAILENGNVGIGTSTPSSKLTVAGDVYITGALRDSSNSAGTNGYILQTTGSGTQWVATSSLGIGGGAATARRCPAVIV